MGDFLLFVLYCGYRQPEWMEDATFLAPDADFATPVAGL
jgi:hypothetical protein